MSSSNDVKTYWFEDDGRIPNNPDLPMLVYPRTLALDDNPTAACRALFERNGWSGTWINGVFRYHHYHSNAHEVLGVVSGSATIQFGGPQGNVIEVQAGDVVVLPAGTGHCNQGASGDFRVVGAYPRGQEGYDLHTGQPDERPGVLENIRNVPLPESDPVQGESGALVHLWRSDS